jgi:hypothetical protein
MLTELRLLPVLEIVQMSKVLRVLELLTGSEVQKMLFSGLLQMLQRLEWLKKPLLLW